MNTGYENQQEPPQINDSLLKLFEKISFRERIIRIIDGLKQDHESGAYKWARFELQRTWSLLSSLLIPALAILLIVFCTNTNVTKEPVYDAKFLTPEPPAEPLAPIPDDKKIIIEPPPDLPTITPYAANSSAELNSPITKDPSIDNQPITPDNMPVREVCKNSSQFKMWLPSGPRSEKRRKEILESYVNSPATENAVSNALRWLKHEQKIDGSWDGYSRAGVTALATLTFLAHGETPSSTSGFETTVHKALQWLCDNQEENGHFKGRDQHDYAHPICTYALCEAYTLTKIPVIRIAAEKALKVIIDGQHPAGGWDYNCRQSDRNDTSYMGWCVQALKAAYIGKIGSPDEINKAMKYAAAALKCNANSAGWFGYVNNQANHTGLTGVGILSLQILDVAPDREVKSGIAWCTRNLSSSWDKSEQARPLYVWYYLTQAYFHNGGSIWKNWDSRFLTEVARKQNIIKGASADGKDIGFWETPGASEKEYGRVYDTTLCALMLQVYYRYLPTYAKIGTAETAKSLDYSKALVEVTMTTPK